MDDYISRKAAREAFENADADVCESYPDGACDWGFGMKNIQEVIDGIPAADVEPVRRGRWECVYDDSTGETDITCSHCKNTRTVQPLVLTQIYSCCLCDLELCHT